MFPKSEELCPVTFRSCSSHMIKESAALKKTDVIPNDPRLMIHSENLNYILYVKQAKVKRGFQHHLRLFMRYNTSDKEFKLSYPSGKVEGRNTFCKIFDNRI